MTTHDTQPTARELGDMLAQQGRKLGYGVIELKLFGMQERLVWEPTVYGRRWTLDGSEILSWNEIQGRFVVPELELSNE